MFLDPHRKPVGKKRTVILFLAFSLLFHAAVLVFFAIPAREKNRPSRIEVSLVSLPPRIAGGSGEEKPPDARPRSLEPLGVAEAVSARPDAPVGKRAKRSAAAASGTTDRPQVFSRAVPEPRTAPPKPPLPERKTSSVPDRPQTVLASPTGRIIESPSPPAAGPSQKPGAAVPIEKGTASTSAPRLEAIPRYDRNAPPPYPRLARERGWEGEVLLRVIVSETGGVRDAFVKRSSGYAVLDAAALKAVRRWRFHPSLLGSTPVEGEVLVPLRFKIKDF